jgi:hypothetical protein
MRKRIVDDGWRPKYYTGDRVITADHVTQGSMVLALLNFLWEIGPLIRYFVQGKSRMPCHRFKHQ